ncbi:MAG TPA: hypothetical protein VMD25_10270 [Acidobacteriaceae bacterium]|nr:hypothetical protein [Acidobacteriaceae bacterium]
MSEAVRRLENSDRAFFLLLLPLAALSLPSLAYCTLELALWLHGSLASGPVIFHLPPRSAWDMLFAIQSSAYDWVSRWNSAVTLMATAFFVSTLLRPRWRAWTGLALIPYGLLLCADFTLRWRIAF